VLSGAVGEGDGMTGIPREFRVNLAGREADVAGLPQGCKVNAYIKRQFTVVVLDCFCNPVPMTVQCM